MRAFFYALIPVPDKISQVPDRCPTTKIPKRAQGATVRPGARHIVQYCAE